MKILKTCLALTTACLLAAAGAASAQSGSSAGKSGGSGGGGSSGQLGDAEIAHIAVTANQIDIDAGKAAEKKAHSPEVKSFAKQMVTDHTSVNKQAAALAKKLKVTPKDNPTSKSLKADAKKAMTDISKHKGADFDKAYIDHEVAYHQAVIKAVDETLIPGAKNEELKSFLTQVRPALQKHLDHAQQLQQTLASGGGTAGAASGGGSHKAASHSGSSGSKSSASKSGGGNSGTTGGASSGSSGSTGGDTGTSGSGGSGGTK
jgi:putative membrane protein